jgi:hypothetical protein
MLKVVVGSVLGALRLGQGHHVLTTNFIATIDHSGLFHLLFVLSIVRVENLPSVNQHR